MIFLKEYNIQIAETTRYTCMTSVIANSDEEAKSLALAKYYEGDLVYEMEKEGSVAHAHISSSKEIEEEKEKTYYVTVQALQRYESVIEVKAYDEEDAKKKAIDTYFSSDSYIDEDYIDLEEVIAIATEEEK